MQMTNAERSELANGKTGRSEEPSWKEEEEEKQKRAGGNFLRVRDEVGFEISFCDGERCRVRLRPKRGARKLKVPGQRHLPRTGGRQWPYPDRPCRRVED